MEIGYHRKTVNKHQTYFITAVKVYCGILDCSFQWGLRTPDFGEGEAVGGRGMGMVLFETALVSSY